MKAIDLIKKLLRLHRSSNPHEAALAMAKALEIAAKHRIDLETVDPDERAAESAVGHYEVLTDCRIACERRYAAKIVELFFNVTTVLSPKPRTRWMRYGQSSIYIVGSQSDLEIARYVFGFLVQHFRHCWRHHRGRLRDRDAFMWGMFVGLRGKLAAAQPPRERNELIPAHGRYLEEIGVKLAGEGTTLGCRGSNAAMAAGFAQGQATEIRGGLRAEMAAPGALEAPSARPALALENG